MQDESGVQSRRIRETVAYRVIASLGAVVFIVGLGVMAFKWLSPQAVDTPTEPMSQSKATQVSQDLIPKPSVAKATPPKDLNAPPDTWSEFKASPRKDDSTLVAQIEKADWWKNCAAWGVEARRKSPSRKMWALQAKLLADSMINGIDLGGVKGTTPEVGMTTCGAFAVMGLPEATNRTVTAAGKRTQLVWRNPRVYAYTQSASGDGNALIHSVQH